MRVLALNFNNQQKIQSINFKNNKELSQKLAQQAVDAGVAYETIGEINKLLMVDKGHFDKIKKANDLAKTVQKPIELGLVQNINKYYKNAKEAVILTRKMTGIEPKQAFIRDGVVYTCANAKKEIYVMLAKEDENGEIKRGYIKFDPNKKTYNFSFADFDFPKEILSYNAFIENGEIKNLKIDFKENKDLQVLYNFDENNRIKSACTIVFQYDYTQKENYASFAFSKNGVVNKMVKTTYNRDENILTLDNFDNFLRDASGKLIYVGSQKGCVERIDELLNKI